MIESGEQPFKVLGHRDGVIFFLQKGTGSILSSTPGSFSENFLLQLAPLNFWTSKFGGHSSQRFSKIHAIDWLLRTSEASGRFQLEKIRGRGAWEDNEKYLFHCGESLFVEGKEYSISEFSSKYLYPYRDQLPLPSSETLSDGDGVRILSIIARAHWKRPVSAKLLAGWITSALICGILKWRPHVWITGGAGSGKSTLQSEVIAKLLEGFAINAQGNSTEAGIRQRLISDALPVLFDEAEQNNLREASRMQNVISLIRQSSTNSGNEIIKGSQSGLAQSYLLRSMFCLSSIQAGLKHKADLERISLLELKPKTQQVGGSAAWAVTRNELLWLNEQRDISARLLRRCLDNLVVFRQNIDSFSAAASDMFGNSREGDQIGTLMAGAWMLQSTSRLAVSEALKFLEQEDWSEHKDKVEGEESETVFKILLQALLKTDHGERSVAELIENVTNYGVPIIGPEGHAKEVLGRAGLKIKDGFLFIDNSSVTISNIFRETAYGADWRAQLLRLKEAAPHDKTIRIGNVPTRAIKISLTAFLNGVVTS